MFVPRVRRELGVDCPVAGVHAAHRIGEFGGRAILKEISRHAGLEGAA